MGGPRKFIFQSEGQATRTCCGRLLVSPKPGWFEHAMPGYGRWGVNGCQGAPYSEELDGKGIPGAAGGDLEPRESTVFCTWSTWSTCISPSSSVILY